MSNKDLFKIIHQLKRKSRIWQAYNEEILIYDFVENNAADGTLLDVLMDIDFTKVYSIYELRELIERMNEMSSIKVNPEQNNECDLLDIYPSYSRFIFEVKEINKINNNDIPENEKEIESKLVVTITCIFPSGTREQ